MFDQEPVKVCPECAGEYRPDIERCADCGVPLVHPEEIAARDARELRRSPGLVAVRTAPIDQARAFVADLAEKSIGYYVDRRRARREGVLTIYVQWQDRASVAASGEQEPVLVEEMPFLGPRHELPPRDDLVCVLCGFLKILQLLSERLDEAGIAHLLDRAPFDRPTIGCLYVLPADGDAAAALADGPDDDVERPDLLAELAACPFCGAPRSAGALECRVCRLGFESSREMACSHCGAIVRVETLHCPNCAAALPAEEAPCSTRSS